MELDRAEIRFWVEELQLGLGIWHGLYQEIEANWLRWYDANDVWIPTQEELIEHERQRAEQERQRAEHEQHKVEMLQAQLRALGIEPEI